MRSPSAGRRHAPPLYKEKGTDLFIVKNKSVPFLLLLGLPGLGNFIGEVLVLIGAWRVNVPLTVTAALGVLAATTYALTLVQQAFHGRRGESGPVEDLSWRQIGIFGAMSVLILWLGLHPQPVLDAAASTLHQLEHVHMGQMESRHH
jgi:NADH-quinone oxidoreductase subunit M